MDSLKPKGMKLWKHQEDALALARDRNFFGLFMDPGVGKTLTAIRILEDVFLKEGRLLRTLVLTPAVVVETWSREFKKYSSIHSGNVSTLTGPTSRRRIEYLNADWPQVFITNYDALYSRSFYLALEEIKPEVIILDESHRIKDPGAKRTKMCLKLGEDAKYRYILTGTAVLNTAMDLFTQVKFLDHGETFGKNFYIFRAQYFEDRNRARAGTHSYFPAWALRQGSGELIREKIKHLSIRTKKDEALDLPPFVKQEQFVEMGDEQAACYKQMKKDFIAYLGDKACTAQIALTKALRLQQIVSGFIKFEDGTAKHFDGIPRLGALRELLADLTPEHKVIVWSVFKENYVQIASVCKELGIDYCEIHGSIVDKDDQVQAFNTDPTKRVMIGHPGAGGIGISLIPASYSIWYSRNFSLEQDIQATARNYRGGSEVHEKITRIDIIAHRTIDEVIRDAINNKIVSGEALMGVLRNLV